MTTETELDAEASGTRPAQDMPPPTHLREPPAIQIKMPNSSGAGETDGQSRPKPNSLNNVEGLLHNLMSRLDENDQRYGSALENMNHRLNELGDRALSAESSGPAESIVALDRVRKKASTLADHIHAADQLHKAHQILSAKSLAERVSSVADHIEVTDTDNHDPLFDPDPGPAVNDDFADVTKRLENSLVANEPADNFDHLINRMDDLASRFDAASEPADNFDHLANKMDDLASRFDAALDSKDNVQALEKIENQLNILTDSFSDAHQQHARVESIESHLHKLMEWANSADASSGEKPDVRFDAIEQAIKALNDNAREMDSQTAGMLEEMNATLQSLAKRIDEPAQKAAPQKHTHRDALQADYPEVWISDEIEANSLPDERMHGHRTPDPNQMGATIPDYQPGPGYPEASIPHADSIISRDKAAGPPEPALDTENDFIASAQRVAAAVDAQDTPASPLMADNRRFPGYGDSSLLPETKRQRPLLVMAAVGLLLVSAGLLYSRLNTATDTTSENGAAQMAPQLSSPSSLAPSGSAPSGAGTPSPNPSNVKPQGSNKQHSGRLQNQNEPAQSSQPAPPETATSPATVASYRPASAAIAAKATQTLTKPNFSQPISTATLLASLSQTTRGDQMSGVSISIKEAAARTAPGTSAPSLVPPGNEKLPAAPMAQPMRVPAPARTARSAPQTGSLDSAPANELEFPANDIATAMPPATIGPQSLRMAAARGNPAAQVEVASRYAKGSGVTQNLKTAVEWFERAAAQGYAPAQYRLAALHERGKGVKKDIGMAQTWYRRAAELGNVRAMHNLAVLYTRPGGKGPDYVIAKNWFYRGASYGLADSQFNLGILYERGLGAPKNIAEAYKWFTLAARQGDNGAQKRRELIRPQLSANALSAVEQILKSWKAVPVKQAANRTGQPKGGWQNARTENQSAGSDPALIARAQFLLNKLGYNAGTPDGKMGPKTAAAIRKFEGRTRKAKTGKVTPVLLRRLEVLSG